VLTRADILSYISSLPGDVRGAYDKGLHLGANGAVAGGADPDVWPIYLDLPFFFRNLKTSPLTTFCQPLQIEVNWTGFKANNSVFEWGEDVTITDVTLYCRFQSMMEQTTNETVNSLYDSGLLTTAVRTYTDENAEDFTIVATGAGVASPTSADLEFTVPIKTTSVITRCYVYATIEPNTAWSTVAGVTAAENARARGRPVPLTGNLTFRSNGQDHISVPVDLLRYYGECSQQGQGGFSSSQHGEDSATANGSDYVYCLDWGSGQDTQKYSGYMSCRELASPQITGTVAANPQWAMENGTKCTVHVQFERIELCVTVSSNGKMNISLSK